jgi:hypothetical protein
MGLMVYDLSNSRRVKMDNSTDILSETKDLTSAVNQDVLESLESALTSPAAAENVAQTENVAEGNSGEITPPVPQPAVESASPIATQTVLNKEEPEIILGGNELSASTKEDTIVEAARADESLKSSAESTNNNISTNNQGLYTSVDQQMKDEKSNESAIKPKNKSKLLLIAAGLILIALLTAAGLVLFSSKQENAPNELNLTN